MIVDKKYSIMIGVGLAVALLVGCGSGANDSNTTKASEDEVTDDGNNTKDENNNTDSVVAGYVAGNGVLFETKSNGDKLVWVNTTRDDVCKISRSTERTGTVYADGVAHCENLNYAGITTWRLPSVSEAQSLMKRENKSILIFPTSNPNCAIMTTNRENTFVYTTSDWNIRDGNPVGGAFEDMARNNKTAGIRCVADVQ